MLASHPPTSERAAPPLRNWGMWTPESPTSPSEAQAIDGDPSTWPRSATMTLSGDLPPPILIDAQPGFTWGSSTTVATSTPQDALAETSASSDYFGHTLRPPLRAMTDGQLDSVTSSSLLESSFRNADDGVGGDDSAFWRPEATEPSSPDGRSLADHSQTSSPASANGPGWRTVHYSHGDQYRPLPVTLRPYEQERPVAGAISRWDAATASEAQAGGQMASVDGGAWNDESSEEPFSPLADPNDGRLFYGQPEGITVARRMTEGDFRSAEERYRSTGDERYAATAFEGHRASDAGLSYTSSTANSAAGLPFAPTDRSNIASAASPEPLPYTSPYHYRGLGAHYNAAMPSGSTGWATAGQGSYVPSTHGPTVPSSTYHISSGAGGLSAHGWSSSVHDPMRSSSFGGISYSTGLYTGHGMSSIYPYFPIVKHRRRTTKEQFIKLEGQFRENPKPSSAVRKALSKQVGMTDRAVQIWFQNRRAKAKALAKKQAAEEAAKKNAANASAANAAATTGGPAQPCLNTTTATGGNDEGRSQGTVAPGFSSSSSSSALRLQPPSESSSSPYQRFNESIYRRRI